MEEREFAVALRYVPGIDQVPLILVNGQGEIAHAIVELAKKLSLPIVKKPELASELMRVPAGHPIPEELYEAVAVILATLLAKGQLSS